MRGNQGADIADTKDAARLIGKKYAKGIGTRQNIHRLPQSFEGITLVEIVKQTGSHLRIRFGMEPAGKPKSRCDFVVIFDDPIVNESYFAAVVRVCIDIVYTAVGGPSCVTDTADGVYGRTFTGLPENGNPTGFFAQK